MAAVAKLTVTVSSRGQIPLPKTIRDQRRWRPGTQLIVENTEDGVVLKTAPVFAPTRPQDVFGSLGHVGRAKTLNELQAAIGKEARRRHAPGGH
jgi:AbrB family looped-hinge helix DNA binding protein